MQPQLEELVETLVREGYRVHIETNGTHMTPGAASWITCSPKAPKYEIMPRADEVKLVVSKDLPLKKALEIAGHRCSFVWLQPCDGPWLEQSKKTILKWIEKYPNHFRAGIQLHKYYNER